MNLEQFSRNFCRALFEQMGSGFVLVFDDLQEGPGASLFGPFLSAVMAELPQDSSLIVISREEPYPIFARDRLNHSLAHLGWNDLRLSKEEARHFLTWSGNNRLQFHNNEQLRNGFSDFQQHLYRRAGWF